ncbi:MAG: ribosome biogenesis GTP-binding protein YihA/YsxC [Rickettsiales bacterium]
MKTFHRDNISVFRTAYIPGDFVKSDLPEFAFIGRSNVGKSSLINALSGNSNIAKTSNMPGKTVSVNYFKVKDGMLLVDLPGYGFAKLPKQEIAKIGRLIASYFAQAEELKTIFVLIDARHPMKESDLGMIDQLSSLSKEICIVMTKCDKKNIDIKFWNKEFDKLKNLYSCINNMFFTSSKSKSGMQDLEKLIINNSK